MTGEEAGTGEECPGGAEPGSVEAEPGAVEVESGAGEVEPGAVDAEPGAGGVEPGAVDAEPGAGGVEPGAVGAEPGAGGVEPGAVDAEPGAARIEDCVATAAEDRGTATGAAGGAKWEAGSELASWAEKAPRSWEAAARPGEGSWPWTGRASGFASRPAAALAAGGQARTKSRLKALARSCRQITIPAASSSRFTQRTRGTSLIRRVSISGLVQRSIPAIKRAASPR
jgi:hypothetical protein